MIFFAFSIVGSFTYFSKNILGLCRKNLFLNVGQSGLVQFTTHGDRVPTYVFQNVLIKDEQPASSKILFTYNSMSSQQISDVVRNSNLELNLIVWPHGKNGTGELPKIKMIDGKKSASARLGSISSGFRSILKERWPKLRFSSEFFPTF